MKRILSIALVLSMLLSLCSFFVSAKTWEDDQVIDENGDYIFDNAYGFVFNIDYVNGVINGEDITLITNAEAYEVCNPVWAVNVHLAATENEGQYSVVEVILCRGFAADIDISFAEGDVVLVIHSAYSNPDSVGYKAKCAALALKEGDIIKVDGDKAIVQNEDGSFDHNLAWSFDSETGELTVSGTGDMDDYYYASDAPWYSLKTSIHSVRIGDGVFSVGDMAFNGYSNLKQVYISKSVSSVGRSAFSNCSNLDEVHITSLSDWVDISFDDYSSNPLGNRADLYLNGTKVTELSLSVGIDSIGRYAFYGCNSLTDVSIPYGVTSIGANAFGKCYNITGISLPQTVTSIGTAAFANCTSLKTHAIPDKVTSVEPMLLFNCTSLKTVSIPYGVTYIGESAFSGCMNLTNPSIPASVTSIGNSAFENCGALTNITVPEGVTSIGDCAFKGCYRLSAVSLPKSLITIGADGLYGCASLTSITIPEGVTSIGASAFSACSMLGAISVDENNTVYSGEGNCLIEKETGTIILGCKNSVIPNSVTSIADYAFSYCTGLTEIAIPDSVSYIGFRAFSSCSSLTRVTLPKGITSISEYAFSSCSNLKEIVIPDGVTSIGAWSFSYCSGLESVTIPYSVNSIGDKAFYNCTSLKTIIYAGDEADWSEITVGGSNDSLATAFQGSKCTHTWQTTTTATCTQGGETLQTCSTCGASRTTAVDALGHTEGEWVTLEDGSKELRCTVCGELIDSKPAYELGDVTGDGKVNMFDYMKVKSYCFNVTELTDDQLERADISGDGKINMFDYMKIKAIVFAK